MKLFTDKTRWQHFAWAIPIGAVLTILCVLGVASGMEFKDYQWCGKADWKDWWTLVGYGMIGQAMQVFVIWLNLNY